MQERLVVIDTALNLRAPYLEMLQKRLNARYLAGTYRVREYSSAADQTVYSKLEDATTAALGRARKAFQSQKRVIIGIGFAYGSWRWESGQKDVLILTLGMYYKKGPVLGSFIFGEHVPREAQQGLVQEQNRMIGIFSKPVKISPVMYELAAFLNAEIASSEIESALHLGLVQSTKQ